jgi:tripartite-type tricarboxylate transporter receptor subunit TctC
VGKGAPPAFRRGHSVTRLCPLYAVLLCAVTLLPLAGRAQDLPPRAIRIIVPSPPGAAGDISARLIGQKLSESLRQPVVVENQAGASGAIGMSMLRRAAPDGTTVGVVIALAQTIDRIQNKKASFDIVKDFTPITAIANNPAGLVVNSRLAAASLTAFVDLVRKHPREISYASGGIGTAHHLYGQILNRTAGIEMLYVPYKGVAPAVNDCLGRPRSGGDRQPGDRIAAYPKRPTAPVDRIRHQALREAAGRTDHRRGDTGLRARTHLDRLAGAAAAAGRDHRALA